MKELADAHNIKHNFTVAYSLWVNGTVERCMKTTQEAYRCPQSELRLGAKDWPSVVGMIQTIINESLLRRLSSRGREATYATGSYDGDSSNAHVAAHEPNGHSCGDSDNKREKGKGTASVRHRGVAKCLQYNAQG